MAKVRTLTLWLQNHLQSHEAEALRGSVLRCLSEDSDVLCHNHVGTGYRYSYPLIQYKSLCGHGVIVCVGDAVDHVGKLLNTENLTLRTYERTEPIMLSNVSACQYEVQVWDSPMRFSLRRWLALNEKNYSKYKEMKGDAERKTLLTCILTGNMLSLCKGIGIRVEKQIENSILKMTEIPTSYKGVRMSAFNCEIATNLSLPAHVSLGKGASLGFGTLFRPLKKDKGNNEEIND